MVDGVISDVYEGAQGEIGMTLRWHLSLFSYLHYTLQNALLTAATWHDYQVNALRIGEVELDEEFRWRSCAVLPSGPCQLPTIEVFQASLLGSPKAVLCAKDS